MTLLLAETGDLAAAEATCAAGLARCREAGDMWSLSSLLCARAELDLRTHRTQDAAAHLREALQITARTGGGWELVNILYACAWLCAGTARPTPSRRGPRSPRAPSVQGAFYRGSRRTTPSSKRCAAPGRPSGPPGPERPSSAARR